MTEGIEKEKDKRSLKSVWFFVFLLNWPEKFDQVAQVLQFLVRFFFILFHLPPPRLLFFFFGDQALIGMWHWLLVKTRTMKAFWLICLASLKLRRNSLIQPCISNALIFHRFLLSFSSFFFSSLCMLLTLCDCSIPMITVVLRWLWFLTVHFLELAIIFICNCILFIITSFCCVRYSCVVSQWLDSSHAQHPREPLCTKQTDTCKKQIAIWNNEMRKGRGQGKKLDQREENWCRKNKNGSSAWPRRKRRMRDGKGEEQNHFEFNVVVFLFFVSSLLGQPSRVHAVEAELMRYLVQQHGQQQQQQQQQDASSSGGAGGLEEFILNRLNPSLRFWYWHHEDVKETREERKPEDRTEQKMWGELMERSARPLSPFAVATHHDFLCSPFCFSTSFPALSLFFLFLSLCLLLRC